MNTNIVKELNNLDIDTSKLYIPDVYAESKESKEGFVSMTDEQSRRKTTKEKDIDERTPLEDIKLQLLIQQTKSLKSIKYMLLILFVIVIISVSYSFIKYGYYGFMDALSMTIKYHL